MDDHLEPAPILDSARVVFYANTGGAATYTGRHVTYVGGNQIDPSPRLAICEDLIEGAFLLMQCDNSWNVLAASFHSSVEAAKENAEETYTGISVKWRKCRELTEHEYLEIADLRQRLRAQATEYPIDRGPDAA